MDPVLDPAHIAATARLTRDEEDFASDVIIVLVEGPSWAWWQFKSYHSGYSAAARSMAHVFVREVEQTWHGPKPAKGAGWVHITPDVVHEGCRRLLDGPVKGLHDNTRARLIGAWATHDAGNIDPALADVIVQVAVFGEVVYG